MELKPVTLDELIWAAEELKKTRRLSTAQHDVLIAERLHSLVHNSRSSVRTLIEDKILAKMPSSSATPTTSQPPTAKDLQRVGLTLSMIAKSDANITPKALIFAGVLRSFQDAHALGVKNWKDFIDHVGRPSQVYKWLQQTDETCWTQGFLGQVPFTFNDWVECRYTLEPRELVLLGFWLGTHLNVRNSLWKRAKENATQWLTVAPQEEWIHHNQLTVDQYSSLLTPTTTDSPSTIARNPGLIIAQKQQRQNRSSSSSGKTTPPRFLKEEEEVGVVESPLLPPTPAVKSGMLVHFRD